MGLRFSAGEVATPPVKLEASRLKMGLRFGYGVFGFWGEKASGFRSLEFQLDWPPPGPYHDMAFWAGRIFRRFQLEF